MKFLNFQGEQIYPSEDPHILDSDNILAIQSVRTQHSGKYACTATSELGYHKSKDIMLDVKCKTLLIFPFWHVYFEDSPKCLPDQQLEFQATPFLAVPLSCTVLANPRENVSFQWIYNTSEVQFEDKVFQDSFHMMTRTIMIIVGHHYRRRVHN